MSQAETETSRTRELRDMAGEGEKKPGCCTRCPCLCGGILLVTALVSLAGAAVIGGFYLQLHHLVDNMIEEVRSETVCVQIHAVNYACKLLSCPWYGLAKILASRD